MDRIELPVDFICYLLQANDDQRFVWLVILQQCKDVSQILEFNRWQLRYPNGGMVKDAQGVVAEGMQILYSGRTDDHSSNRAFVVAVIRHLNDKAGTPFQAHFPGPAGNAIIALRKCGYTIADFQSVINKKCKQWLGTKWQIYLRPKTLFKRENFESYAGELDIIKAADTIGEFADVVRAAKANVAGAGEK